MRKNILFFVALKAALFGFCFEEAAAEYGLEPSTLWTIAKIESNLNPNTYYTNKNGTADIGLMQINTANLDDLRRLGYDYGDSIWEPCTNVKVGAWILRGCYDKFGESWKTIDCYNKGKGGAKEFNGKGYTSRFLKAFSKEYGYASK